MDPNPYAAPEGPVQALPVDAAPAWTFAEAFAIARRVTRQYGVWLFVASAAVAGVHEDVEFLVGRLLPRPDPGALTQSLRPPLHWATIADYFTYVLLGLAMQITLDAIASAGLEAGLVRIYLGAIRGQRPTFRVFLGGFSTAISMVLVMLAWSFGSLAGAALLCIPGLIVQVAFLWAGYFAATGLSAGAALRASWRATRQGGTQLILFALGAVVVTGVLFPLHWSIRVLGSFVVDLVVTAVFSLMTRSDDSARDAPDRAHAVG